MPQNRILPAVRKRLSATRLEDVPREVYVLTDSTGYYILTPKGSGRPINFDWDGDGIDDSNGPLASLAPWYQYNWFRPRHPFGSLAGGVDARGANFMFVDMHVSYLTFRQWLENENGVWGGGDRERTAGSDICTGCKHERFRRRERSQCGEARLRVVHLPQA